MSDTTAVTEELKKALAAEEGGRRWLRRLAIWGTIALVVAFGALLKVTRPVQKPARFAVATVAVGDIVEKVQATGTVQPLLQVTVSALVNGRVLNVPVDFNSVVKKGALLAEIDSTIYGSLASGSQAGLLSQNAQVESAKATAAMQKVNLERVQKLYAQGLASKGELDAAQGTYDVGMANVRVAQATLAARQAQVSESMTNVSRTKIYSPVDGVVVNRAIDPGSTVNSSFNTPTLFVIAQDLTTMRVLADVDEADVGKLKEGMEAEAVVDAFPGEIFHGVVKQIRFNPNTVQGVVTYPTVLDVANPEEKLRPGMTATVTVKTHEVRGVARIPNAALRYKPSPPLTSEGKPVVQPPEPPLAKGQGRVHLIIDDKVGYEKDEKKQISIGVTDGMFTEVTGGSLPLGAKVVTDETDDEQAKKKKK